MLTRKQKTYVLLIVLSTLILAAVPLVIRRLFFVVDNVSTNDWLVSIIFPAIIMLVLLLLPFLAKKIFPTLSGFDLTWTRKPRAKIRWYFLLILAPLIANAIIRAISHHTNLPMITFFNYEDVTRLTLTFFILEALRITILTPIAEEVFWRGYIQDQFNKCFGGTISVFLQAFLFALAHCYPLLGFIRVFVLGLIFGFWRLKRRSLVPIIIVHAILNGMWSLVFYSDQYEMSKIKIAVNYIEEINKIGNTFAAEDNAEPDYQKAIDLYNPPSEALYDFKIIKKNLWPDELPAEQRQALEQWLTHNDEALVQFRLATGKLYYWPQYAGGMMLEADNSVEYRQLTELACALCWNARFSASNGDLKQAVDDLVFSFRFGNQSLIGPKPMISFLVGAATKANVCGTVFFLIEKKEMNAEQLDSFQKQLQQEYQNIPSTLDLTWDKFTLYDIIQRIFTDDGNGDGHIPGAELKLKGRDVETIKVLAPDISDEQMKNWKKCDRKTTTKLVDDLFDFFNSALSKTPAQLKNEDIDISSKINETMSENVLYPYVINMTIIHQLFYKNRAVQDALIATLAVFRYEKANNSFPENLDVLVSGGYLDKIPMDPFSNGPLIYKKETDNFLLYSVGVDFDDDGGNHKENWGKTDDDYVFWPVQHNNASAKEILQTTNE